MSREVAFAHFVELAQTKAAMREMLVERSNAEGQHLFGPASPREKPNCKIEVVYGSSRQPFGTVIAQSPERDVFMRQGGTVNLTVAR